MQHNDEGGGSVRVLQRCSDHRREAVEAREFLLSGQETPGSGFAVKLGLPESSSSWEEGRETEAEELGVPVGGCSWSIGVARSVECTSSWSLAYCFVRCPVGPVQVEMET